MTFAKHGAAVLFLLLAGSVAAAQNTVPSIPSTPQPPAQTPPPAETPPPVAETPPPAPPAVDMAEVLTKVTLDDVRAALLAAGYTAEIQQDNRGSFVTSSVDNNNFFVSLASCDGADICRTLVMETSGWTPKTPPTVDSLNKFHFDHGGWIVAALDPNGYYYGNARASLNGGVTRAWLQDEINAFAGVTRDFFAFMRQ